ncbi:MAG: phosphoenolpyruvate carboxykinase [Candidatus Bathyarchaeota archaeon]
MHEIDLEEFVRTAYRIRERAEKEGRLVNNPSDAELELLVEKEPSIVKTKYGSFVAEAEPTSRSEKFTKNSVDHPFSKAELELLAQCEEKLAKKKLISVDRIVGDINSETTVRLIVPVEFAHIAYGGKNLFIPTKEDKKPTYQIVFFSDEAFEKNKSKPLPEKEITIRLAMLDDGRYVKIVRNSNYIGEYKKGVFAAEDWVAKIRRKGIFLHAGCREDQLQSVTGEDKTTRSLFVALSANGKTTLTCKILSRKSDEKSWLIQDDGGTLMPDGSFHGFEAGGIFVKTEGLRPSEQIEIYYGLLKPLTVCENVHVNETGDFDFFNYTRTSNGRAVVLRRDVMHASQSISVPKIDNFFLITRGPIIPAISKVSRKQAVALMIAGMAMESSAGDPTQAGKIRSVFFYDPFVAGSRTDHANRFYEILKQIPHMNYYLLNTGGVGEEDTFKQITVAHTLAILDSLLRGGLGVWVDSPSGFKVPRAVRDVDLFFIRPEKLFSKPAFEERQEKLNNARREAVTKLGEDLHPDIKKVF